MSSIVFSIVFGRGGGRRRLTLFSVQLLKCCGWVVFGVREGMRVCNLLWPLLSSVVVVVVCSKSRLVEEESSG